MIAIAIWTTPLLLMHVVFAGGNTSITHESNPYVCQIPYLSVDQVQISPFTIFPNPVKDLISIQTEQNQPCLLIVHDLTGNQIFSSELSGALLSN